MRSCSDKERNNYMINEKKQRCNRELVDTRVFINERFEEYAVGNKVRNSEKKDLIFILCISISVKQ